MRLVRAFALFLAVTMISIPAAAEVLVMKEGTRVSGKLKLCDETRCIIGSQRVPLENIAAILLRDDATLPDSAPAGSAIMADGSLRAVRFSGLNLGSVTLNDVEEDREAFVAIVLAVRTPKVASDLLIMRDGSQSSGSISKCTPASCTMNGRLLSRDSIRWIGLRQAGAAPPGSPAADTVLFVSRPDISARVSGIDDSTVRTTHGNFPRRDITWIFIADAKQDAARPEYELQDSPPDPAPGKSDDRSPSPPGKDKPPSTKPPVKRPPSRGEQSGGCKPGPLWTGIIKAHAWGLVDGTRTDNHITVRVLMRESRCPALALNTGKRFGTISIFDVTGSVISNEFKMVDPNFTCKGEGSATVDGTSNGQSLYRNDSAATTKAIWGSEVAKGSALYTLIIAPPTNSHFSQTCRSSDGTTHVNDSSLLGSPVIGQLPASHPKTPFEDPQFRYLDGGRMIGSGRAPAVGAFTTIAFSWAICPEGIQCPPPSDVSDDSGPPEAKPPADDPCDELKRLISEMKALADAHKSFVRDFKDAERKRNVVRDEIWGRKGALRDFFSSMLGIAASNSSGAFQKLVSLSDTLLGMSGEGNGDDVWSAAKAFGLTPEELAKKGVEKAAGEAAVRAATQAADAYLSSTGDDAGALRIYAATLGRSSKLLEQAQSGAAAISFIKDVADYANKTSTLADLVRDWMDYRETAERNQKGMDDINRRQSELQARIDEARAKCPQGAALGHRKWPMQDFNAQSCDTFLLISQNSAPPDPAAAQAQLHDIETQLSSVPPEIAAATPYLLPFIYRIADGVSPKLLHILRSEAAIHIVNVRKALERAAAAWPSTDSNIARSMPQDGTRANPRI